MQSAEAPEQATTFQRLNLYKCFLLLVQILSYWIHSVVTVTEEGDDFIFQFF